MTRAHAPLPRMEAFGLSDVGRVRKGNEDAYLVLPSVGLYAVADGMGGAPAGEVASRRTLDTVQAVFEDPDLTWPSGLAGRPADPGLALLVHSVEHASARVHAEASADRARSGMGTTFTGILVLEDHVAVAHVGDTRAYLLRGRRLHPLTRDHSLVEHLVDLGRLTREQAARSPLRNKLTRAVGTRRVEVDGRLVPVQPGDTLLLASDGLHGVVSDVDLAAVLLGEADLERAATALVERANDAGGPDNITVVLVRLG